MTKSKQEESERDTSTWLSLFSSIKAAIEDHWYLSDAFSRLQGGLTFVETERDEIRNSWMNEEANSVEENSLRKGEFLGQPSKQQMMWCYPFHENYSH